MTEKPHMTLPNGDRIDDIIAKWRDEALPHGHARLPSGEVVDLTAIREPFGLLDAATQEALKAHGGPYEFYSGSWQPSVGIESMAAALTYRVKPAPPTPVVSKVTLYGAFRGGSLAFDQAFYDGSDTYCITLDLIDGKPDLSSPPQWVTL